MAWDPRGRYLATQSSDRTTRVYKTARSQPKKEPQQEETSTAPAPTKAIYSKLITANVISSTETKVCSHSHSPLRLLLVYSSHLSLSLPTVIHRSCPRTQAKAVPRRNDTIVRSPSFESVSILKGNSPSRIQILPPPGLEPGRQAAGDAHGTVLRLCLVRTNCPQSATRRGHANDASIHSDDTVSEDKENAVPDHLPSNCVYVFTRGMLNRYGRPLYHPTNVR